MLLQDVISTPRFIDAVKISFDLMMDSETHLKAFTNLGSETYTVEKLFLTMESFVSQLYGLKKNS